MYCRKALAARFRRRCAPGTPCGGCALSGQGSENDVIARHGGNNGGGGANRVYALVLDALDEEARSWYLGLDFGFKPVLDDPNRLIRR